MKHDSISSGKRKAVNLSIDSGVIAAAREAGLNLSQICETALGNAAKAERDRRWKEEHREAIEANNRWVEENGLPYAHLRLW
jgi:antitoxin CcdA